MSATLNAEEFSKYFNDCPTMHVPGETHPVEDLYLEDILARTNFEFDFKNKPREYVIRPFPNDL